MVSYAKFLRTQAENVYWGRGNTDNPKCPSCRYSFTEEDLQRL